MAIRMIYTSPLGPISLLQEGDALARLEFNGSGASATTPLLLAAARQLDEYFSGRRTEFCLPLEPKGTEFEQDVWAALCAIPFGKTSTYAAIARAIGRPQACRAVGNANAKNPLPIFIPCHRVLAAGGLGGYSSGLEIKRFLLRLEGAVF